MVAVQGKGADPVVRAFNENKQWFEVEPFEPQTICDAIPVGNVLGPGALMVIDESGGQAVAVTDDEAMTAHRLLASKEGLYVEPTSAIPVVAAKKLLDSGVIAENDTVVCVATGAGPNVPEVAEQQVVTPKPIQPNLDELAAML
jgi:threonine synthase